ncbi:MAG: Rpn family recombination-promoting nuclease/putative transposase [Chitinispirillales bacterium]|jgi:predicted transposase/invertase (TIGR01784 family)|nr:Rpn family recombination-promoting nuclease/putative transposase [Chitinispirillales bacterium]
MAATNDENQAQDAGGQNLKHDESYKSVLSNAANFLHFLKKYIAAPWTADISADDLATVNKSFVTPEYREIDSDLIYKLKIKGSDVYFYVLVELQSQVDHTMPFRLLRYMVELLNDLFKNEEKDIRERKDFRLPAIVPIILYNGNDNWTAVRTYKEYTENYEIFGDYIIDFNYLLFDLKRTDEATMLLTKKILDIVFLLDKRRLENPENRVSEEEVTELLEKFAPDMPVDDALALLGWLKHFMYKGKLSPENEENFKNILKGGGNTMKHAVEIWRDEMIDVATRDGRREGERNKAFEIARKLRAKGTSVEDIADATGLTIDEILQL